MTPPTSSEALKAYIRLFENLSDAEIEIMDQYVAQDITFKDPFNDIKGIVKLKALLRKTLEDVEKPNFKVTHVMRSEDQAFNQGQLYILKWDFSGRVPVLGNWEVTGLSEIKLNASGEVSGHVDYWDASEYFYMKLPVIGRLLRMIKRRLQVG